MFSQQEREEITDAFNRYRRDPKDASEKLIRQASRGFDPCGVETLSYCKRILADQIGKGVVPIINNDSLTVWGNEAVLKYGLTVGDIRKLNPGDKLDLIMFDRNVGDYMDGTPKGTKYRPTKEGLVYVTYTHRSGLSGTLKFTDVDVDIEGWEFNIAALGSEYFWGRSPINEKDLPDQIKIGSRGPCILRSDGLKMPEFVTHYDTWYDDYLVWFNLDLSNCNSSQNSSVTDLCSVCKLRLKTKT